MPISRGKKNVFCSDLITMVPKWNFFIFLQIDYPRWLPGTITNQSAEGTGGLGIIRGNKVGETK